MLYWTAFSMKDMNLVKTRYFGSNDNETAFTLGLWCVKMLHTHIGNSTRFWNRTVGAKHFTNKFKNLVIDDVNAIRSPAWTPWAKVEYNINWVDVTSARVIFHQELIQGHPTPTDPHHHRTAQDPHQPELLGISKLDTDREHSHSSVIRSCLSLTHTHSRATSETSAL